VPGAELLLPAWLVIFPNSIPSQFLSDESRQKQFNLAIERRKAASDKLVYILPKYLNDLEKDPSVAEEDKKKIRELKHVFRAKNLLPTDLLQYRVIFTKYVSFRFFSATTLLHIGHFMGLNPVTGLNTINNILRIAKVKIPLEAPGIRLLTRMILTRELNLYFNQLRREDELMSFEQLEKISDEQLDYICYRRGIDLTSRPEKLKDLKLWLSISNLRNVDHLLLLFSRVADSSSMAMQMEISEDEDQFEVLRRDPSEIYFLEKMRVFEKTFGIDQLQALVNKLEHQRKVSLLLLRLLLYIEPGIFSERGQVHL
jgi:hypothetical protein